MSKSQHSEEKPYDGKVCGKTWPCVLTFFGNLTKGENAMNVRNHENDFARVCVFIFWLLTFSKNNPHWRDSGCRNMGNGVSILPVLLYSFICFMLERSWMNIKTWGWFLVNTHPLRDSQNTHWRNEVWMRGTGGSFQVLLFTDSTQENSCWRS